MVAVLTKIFGTENLELAEDVVQDTFIHAFKVWIQQGIPENPSAWLFTVARNKAIDLLRRKKFSDTTDFTASESVSAHSPFVFMDNFWKEELVRDDMLRMMFACCHPDISEENQITLILKLLCGFSTAEIAKAFLTSEETIAKRLVRTKTFFRENKIGLIIPSGDDLNKRTGAVLHSVYLLFNEGYNSTHHEELVRKDLIGEAMLLCKMLTENKFTRIPETFALMALMCFHASRSEGRISPEGEIILLADQDRSTWDISLIHLGNQYMNEAAFGAGATTYHLEAAIAWEHCAAPSFADTNWERIIGLYDWLLQLAPSPLTALNRAVAILQLYGPDSAIEALQSIRDKKKLESFYLYHSLLGEIFTRKNRRENAVAAFQSAAELTRSAAEKRMLKKKIDALM